MADLIDLTGKKFDRLNIIKYVGDGKWLCKCDCGKLTTSRSYDIRKGLVKSCGCLARENIIKASLKHGKRHTRIYYIWCSMKDRCLNKNHKAYQYYGGRGISICKEWENDFMCFYNWAIKNGYTDTLTIERIDVNGNYEPSNCKWITKAEQAHNKQNSIKYNINGECLGLKQISDKFNIQYDVLYDRLFILNWDINEAITREVKNMPRKKSSSGERHIYKNGNSFRVQINNVYYGLKDSLEDAIILRDKKLEEMKNG